MSLNNKTVLVSGANRGIGAATVRELLSVGVKKIYVGARNVETLPDFGDTRTVPIQLDVNDRQSIGRAAEIADDIDVLFNNAGIMTFGDLITDPHDVINADMETNFYGTLRVIRAFTPRLIARGSGTIVNVVSIAGLASVPVLGGYSISKAALQSLTQTLRGTLKKSGIDVIGIYPGPVDTDLTANIPLAKASAEHVAANIVRGMEKGEVYIFPDPQALQVEHLWANDGRHLEDAMPADA